MKKLVVLVLHLGIIAGLRAQPDTSCGLRISLLTCSPGQELYSTFGHSALRVINDSAHTDLVFNYGTFDFDDPAFYSKFVRGKLLYFVSIERFGDFLQEYEYEQRGIREQVLNMSCTEKQRLISALEENAKEENKYYQYDFIYDNCTTRLRDIVFKQAQGPVVTKDIVPAHLSFRNLIHEYLDKGDQPWSKLGIDILLGMPLDKQVSNSEAMFLPDYLYKGFDSSHTDNKPLVAGITTVLSPAPQVRERRWFSPFVVFSMLFLAILVAGLFRNTNAFLSVFDFFLFFLTGALGLLILFMWFGTDHPECKNNLNLAWAFPLHVFVVFFLYRKLEWLKYYFLANSILLLLLLILWKWLPQQLNPVLVPIVCTLLLRSFLRYQKLNAWLKRR